MQIDPLSIDPQLRGIGKMADKIIDFYLKQIFSRVEKRGRQVVKPQKARKCKGIKDKEVWISREQESSSLRMRIYSPLHPSNQLLPGVLWLHGGGYAIGSPETSHVTIKKLVQEGGCVVIAPYYSLSVEKPYPGALFDAYTALRWMKNNTSLLGIREDQIMIGGESAGGGLVAALSLYARDKEEVNIAFQMPLYPMLDDRMITDSSQDNDAPIWNSKRNKMAWKLYLGDLKQEEIPSYAAAARAKDFSRLPPTCTFVGDLEPFRDETIEYVENLRKEGIEVDFTLFKGCYHSFDIACPKAEVSKQAQAFLMSSFKKAKAKYFASQ